MYSNLLRAPPNSKWNVWRSRLTTNMSETNDDDDQPPLPSALSSSSSASNVSVSDGNQAIKMVANSLSTSTPMDSSAARGNCANSANVDGSIFSNATFSALTDSQTEFRRWRPVLSQDFALEAKTKRNNNFDKSASILPEGRSAVVNEEPKSELGNNNDVRSTTNLEIIDNNCTVVRYFINNVNHQTISNNVGSASNLAEQSEGPLALPKPLIKNQVLYPPPLSITSHIDEGSISVNNSLSKSNFFAAVSIVQPDVSRFVHPTSLPPPPQNFVSFWQSRPMISPIFFRPNLRCLPPLPIHNPYQNCVFQPGKRPHLSTFRPVALRMPPPPVRMTFVEPPSTCAPNPPPRQPTKPPTQSLSTSPSLFNPPFFVNTLLRPPLQAPPYKRFCQTKIMELWHLLSANVEKAKETFYGDLWLPPNEDAFTIDCSSNDAIKTLLALRTPVWPPVVSKILLICVKKIPCGKDDNCLRRLRDQTRWMRNDLHNHVASYKSFRQLKGANNGECWYLQRHSCEFNLIRFLNSKLYSKAVAELLVKDFFHGLDYLHSQSKQYLFHGSLKPSNVLIDLQGDGRLSLILVDFGFGRLRCPKVGILHETKCLSPNGRKLDELCWKPPEFFDTADHKSPSNKYSSASDIYSAALLTYFMLSKRHPFLINFQTTLMHLKRLMQEERYCLDGVEIEAQNVLRPLLFSDARRRPTAGDVLTQPLCWNGERRLKFLTHVAEVIMASQEYLRAPDSRLRAEFRSKVPQIGTMVDVPLPIISRIELILGDRFYPSIMTMLLALKLYIDAKRTNEASSWNSCFFPDDEYQFWTRYASLFWNVLRITNKESEWKVMKVCYNNRNFPGFP